MVAILDENGHLTIRRILAGFFIGAVAMVIYLIT